MESAPKPVLTDKWRTKQTFLITILFWDFCYFQDVRHTGWAVTWMPPKVSKHPHRLPESDSCSQVSEGGHGLAQSHGLWLMPGNLLFWPELSPSCSDVWSQITGGQIVWRERRSELLLSVSCSDDTTETDKYHPFNSAFIFPQFQHYMFHALDINIWCVWTLFTSLYRDYYY